MLKNIESFDGKRIFYHINRESKKMPFLIFMHFLGGNHTVWEGEVSFFRRLKYNAISLDLRGHGLSAKPDKGKTVKMNEFCSDLEEIMKEEGIKKAILVGHSIGGMIALEFYKLFPSRIKALVILDSTPKFSLSALPTSLKLLVPFGNILDFLAKHSSRRLRSVNYYKDRKKPDLVLLFEDESELDMDVGKDFINELFKFDVSSMLGKIKVPTLIIRSKRDIFFTKEVSEEMHNKIKNSELCYVDGNHTSVFKKAKEINGIILKFFKSNGI